MGGSVAGVLQVRDCKLHKYHLANQFIPDLKAMFAVIHETFMSMLGSIYEWPIESCMDQGDSMHSLESCGSNTTDLK